jgi:hypothetical protein
MTMEMDAQKLKALNWMREDGTKKELFSLLQSM